MDEDPGYKLIQPVDPTKIKVSIRNKFAKLTLSSNKKKKIAEQECEAEEQRKSQHDLEKRKSVSRILFDTHSAKPEEPPTTADSEFQLTVRNNYINPILRSSSSSRNDSIENSGDETYLDSADVDAIMNAGGRVEPKDEEAKTNAAAAIENEVEALSQRISSIAMTAKEVANIQEKVSGNINTPKLNLRGAASGIRHNIVNPEESIIISSASEDGDSEYDETESFIIISDSSSHEEPTDPTFDFNLATSTIPDTGETPNLMLPCTLSNDKADRIEAFLRDVHQQEQNPEPKLTDTSKESQITKSQQLAVADTESINEEVEQLAEELHSAIHIAAQPAAVVKKSVLTTDDTVPMSHNESFSFTMTNRETINSVNVRALMDEKAKRWTHNETEENTYMPSVDITCASEDDSNSGATQQSDIPEESIYISDTESEPEKSAPQNDNADDMESRKEESKTESNAERVTEISAVGGTKSNIGSGTESSAGREIERSAGRRPERNTTDCTETEQEAGTEKEMVPSEEIVPDTEEDSSYEESEVRMNVGQISISTKININIQISQQVSTDELSTGSSESDDDDDGNGNGNKKSNKNNDDDYSNSYDVDGEQRSSSANDQNGHDSNTPEDNDSNDNIVMEAKDMDTEAQQHILPMITVAEEEQNQNDTHEPQFNTQTKVCSAPATPETSIETVEDSLEQKKMFQGAADLLTQVYGNAWQTPEVLRSLKKNSAKVVRKHRTAAVVPPKEQLKVQEAGAKNLPEESVLDDFSIFRRDIVRTNLDSTRLVTPKVTKTRKTVQIRTEPRQQKALKSPVKFPHSEVKKRAPLALPQARRVANDRWRQLVDSESEGDNASDDDAIDPDDKESKDSDESWKADDGTGTDSDDSPATKQKTNKSKTRFGNITKRRSKNKHEIVYLDLTKEEIEVQHDVPESPPANHDEKFREHLQDILRTCKPPEKPKLDGTSNKPRRKLFTKTYDDVLVEPPPETSVEKPSTENVAFNLPILPWFTAINKPIEAIKSGNAPLTPTTSRNRDTPKTPRTASKTENKETPTRKGKLLQDKVYLSTPNWKYSFLASLNADIGKPFCDPEAFYYRDNYRTKKEELAIKLYDLYNEKLFENRLNVPLKWNKKLLSTAGRCMNKKRLGERISAIELSEKVLTSADRLRCTLIHELCHAATWIFNGEGGHGNTWKSWAFKANQVFPELPKIGTCHQYDIEYKYTYRCTLCDAKSYAHSKSKKVENIRCAFCHGAIEVYLNKRDKDGNVMPTPVREPTGFAKFVKDNYKKYKQPNMKHTDVMKALGNEFAALKVAGGGGNTN